MACTLNPLLSIFSPYRGDLQYISRLIRLAKHFVPAAIFDESRVSNVTTCCIHSFSMCVLDVRTPYIVRWDAIKFTYCMKGEREDCTGNYTTVSLSVRVIIAMENCVYFHLISSMRKMAEGT